MKKLFNVLVIVLMIAIGSGTAFAVTKKKTTTKATTTKMTPQEFMKKWGKQYIDFQTCDMSSGANLQFFKDLMAGMPNHFKMKYDTKDGGIKYYVGVHVWGEGAYLSVFMFSLGFSGNELVHFQYQVANWDPASKANLCKELKWTRSETDYDAEEKAIEEGKEEVYAY